MILLVQYRAVFLGSFLHLALLAPCLRRVWECETSMGNHNRYLIYPLTGFTATLQRQLFRNAYQFHPLAMSPYHSNETAICTVFEQALPKIGLNGILHELRKVYQSAYLNQSNFLADMRWHFITHLAGSWAMDMALHTPYDSFANVKMTMEVLSTFGVGPYFYLGGSPVHGAIWHAMLDAARQTHELFDIGYNLCAATTIGIGSLLCTHGIGHGLMLAVIYERTNDRKMYSACTQPYNKSGGIDIDTQTQVLEQGLQLIQAELEHGRSFFFLSVASEGLFEQYFKQISSVKIDHNAMNMTDVYRTCSTIRLFSLACFQQSIQWLTLLPYIRHQHSERLMPNLLQSCSTMADMNLRGCKAAVVSLFSNLQTLSVCSVTTSSIHPRFFSQAEQLAWLDCIRALALRRGGVHAAARLDPYTLIAAPHNENVYEFCKPLRSTVLQLNVSMRMEAHRLCLICADIERELVSKTWPNTLKELDAAIFLLDT